MAELTYDDVEKYVLSLPRAEQMAVISKLTHAMSEQLKSSEPGDESSRDEVIPSLASNLYKIAQDLEKNPPTGPGWPRTNE
jgi:hypothetical protein